MVLLLIMVYTVDLLYQFYLYDISEANVFVEKKFFYQQVIIKEMPEIGIVRPHYVKLYGTKNN